MSGCSAARRPRIEALRLAQPVELTGVAPSLRAARGPQEVIVKLRTPSVGRMGARGSEAIEVPTTTEFRPATDVKFVYMKILKTWYF